jgi:hypothetical protein
MPLPYDSRKPTPRLWRTPHFHETQVGLLGNAGICRAFVQAAMPLIGQKRQLEGSGRITGKEREIAIYCQIGHP